VKIDKGKRVRLKVRLQVKGGDVIEESVAEYFQGAGTLLPFLETLVEGLEAGAKRSGVLEAKNAFGSEKYQPTKSIPRSEFPKEAKLVTGSQFQAKSEDGKQDIILRVVESTDKEVRVRLVHPLADKDLSYDLEVLKVTDPTPPPLPVEAIAKEDSSS
jgi:FKBP-type peptidyl-prolyl cis-trans isomerase 2